MTETSKLIQQTLTLVQDKIVRAHKHMQVHTYNQRPGEFCCHITPWYTGIRWWDRRQITARSHCRTFSFLIDFHNPHFYSYIKWDDHNYHGELWRLREMTSIRVLPVFVHQTVILYKLPNVWEAQFPICKMEVIEMPFSSAFPLVTFGSRAAELPS